MLTPSITTAVDTAPARPQLAMIIAAMFALAALDIAGAALARQWADHRAAGSLLAGMAVFALLFVVYGKSLDYAHLTTVTVGWVAMLQVGVILLDRLHGVSIPLHKLGAIAGILVLQVVLLLPER